MQRYVYGKKPGAGTVAFRTVLVATGLAVIPVAGRRMRLLLAAYTLLCLSGCSADHDVLFTRLSEGRPGLHFNNTLREDENANVLNYAYFYNGGGVAIGDINNDGFPDIMTLDSRNMLQRNNGDNTFSKKTGGWKGWFFGGAGGEKRAAVAGKYPESSGDTRVNQYPMDFWCQ